MSSISISNRVLDVFSSWGENFFANLKWKVMIDRVEEWLVEVKIDRGCSMYGNVLMINDWNDNDFVWKRRDWIWKVIIREIC